MYSLAKIAEKFNISKTAVSLILNGKASENRISPELEKAVKSFCESVNYCPNIHARRMRSGHAGNIGLLINKSMLAYSENPFSDQVISEITGGVVLAAAEKNFRVTIQVHGADSDENKMFEWLRNGEIDGLIYYGTSVNMEWFHSFLTEDRFVVGIGIAPMEGITSVNINNRELMHALTALAVNKGRRRFAFLAGMEGYVSMERFGGMLDALKEGGISFNESNLINADFSEIRAYEILSKREIDFDTLVCANDDMAVGAMCALKERGFDIPADISIIGADNTGIAAHTEPKLATLDNMNTALGRTAVTELFKLFKGRAPADVILNSRIIENASI